MNDEYPYKVKIFDHYRKTAAEYSFLHAAFASWLSAIEYGKAVTAGHATRYYVMDFPDVPVKTLDEEQK